MIPQGLKFLPPTKQCAIYSYFILISSLPHSLLSVIQGTCLVVTLERPRALQYSANYFSPPPRRQVNDWQQSPVYHHQGGDTPKGESIEAIEPKLWPIWNIIKIGYQVYSRGVNVIGSEDPLDARSNQNYHAAPFLGHKSLISAFFPSPVSFHMSHPFSLILAVARFYHSIYMFIKFRKTFVKLLPYNISLLWPSVFTCGKIILIFHSIWSNVIRWSALLFLIAVLSWDSYSLLFIILYKLQQRLEKG